MKQNPNTSLTTGTLFIVAAPSGAGKTSLVSALVQANPQCKVSISYTTRPKRPGEKTGSHYHFTTPEDFQKKIKENFFLEYAKVYENYYGTPKTWVENELQKGVDVILEIDWQGAQQIRKIIPQSCGIFILPPSKLALEERLVGREQDPKAIIQKRMAQAKSEMSRFKVFDYLIVNEKFDEALADLKAIFRAHHLRRDRQARRYSHLLAQLLSPNTD